MEFSHVRRYTPARLLFCLLTRKSNSDREPHSREAIAIVQCQRRSCVSPAAALLLSASAQATTRAAAASCAGGVPHAGLSGLSASVDLRPAVAFTPPHAALSELWLVCISTVPHRRMKWTHDRHGRVQNAIGETYRRRIIPMTNSKA